MNVEVTLMGNFDNSQFEDTMNQLGKDVLEKGDNLSGIYNHLETIGAFSNGKIPAETDDESVKKIINQYKVGLDIYTQILSADFIQKMGKFEESLRPVSGDADVNFANYLNKLNGLEEGIVNRYRQEKEKRLAEYKKIFGWDTDATGEEYTSFLRSFLTELLSHLKERGDDKRCFYHISDEPGLAHLENYKKAKETVADLLEGYTIMDALSNFSFYETGVLDHPIPSNNHIQPFLDAGVKDLWTYYCVSQPLKVSNRYISMPSWRNRSIGMQMFKYNIKGFLHWGYNFYNNQYSVDPINPYTEPCADFAFPGGDAFSVYPELDGTALESIRLVVFYEALQDIKAMKLASSLTSHDEVVSAIEDVLGEPLTFDICAKSANTMLKIREAVNEIIKRSI